MRICSTCGAHAADEARFCPSCGHPFESMGTGSSSQTTGGAPSTPPSGPADTSSDLDMLQDEAPPRTGGLGSVPWRPLVGILVTVAVLVMGVPPVAKLLLPPVVCPSHSQGLIMVYKSWRTRRGEHAISYDYYCIDRYGSPRYVSLGKVFLGSVAVVIGLTVLVVGIWFGFSRLTRGRSVVAPVILAVLLAGSTGCSYGTLSDEALREHFKGYLWRLSGQRTFKEHILDELGSRAHHLSGLLFRETEAFFSVKGGETYTYILGRLHERRTLQPRTSPCAIDLRVLDPRGVPKAVAAARALGMHVQAVSVLHTCKSFRFVVNGQDPNGIPRERAYSIRDLHLD